MKFDMHSNSDRPQRVEVTGSHLGTGVGADFLIRIEQPDNLVRIEMGGFFGQDDIQALRRTLEEKLLALTCAPNAHLTLADVRAMKIQTQDVVASFSTVVGDPKFRSKRLAFVTGSSLARLQTRRLTDRPGVAFFTEVEAAEAWLRSGD
jgi:hypothetical protein